MEQELLQTKQKSRKKFLKLLAGSALFIPFLSQMVGGKMYLRRENASTIDFDKIQEVPLSTTVTTVTSDYSILASDDTIFVDCSSNEVFVTLPTAVGKNGKIYNIKCIDDTNSCWISTTGIEEIDGDTEDFELYEDEVATLQSDGSDWRIV